MGAKVGSGLFRPSVYHKPHSVQEVLELLAQYGDSAIVVAGATDVLVERKPGVEALIDITGAGLNYLTQSADGMRIGACVTMAQLIDAPFPKTAAHQVLADAARSMGTPQVRNVATVAGNLCTALPSADLAPPLIAVDAVVRCRSLQGQRMVPAGEFLVGVRQNALRPGEIVEEIEILPQPRGARYRFEKMERAKVADLALVNMAMRIALTDTGVCEDARIVLGAVAPTPIRAFEAEQLLLGKRLGNELIEGAASAAAAATSPISDVRASAEYRREISRVFVRRALMSCCN